MGWDGLGWAGWGRVRTVLLVGLVSVLARFSLRLCLPV